MKKIIAIICTVAMLFSFATTAFADEWDFLSAEYKSYDATVEFSLVMNKPLECLTLVNETAGFDVKYLVEELTKAKYTAKIQAELGEGNLQAKMAMAINADVPVNLSEDLKFGADVTLHMWMEFDFTSVENAKYDIIIKNPLNGQYITLDYFELMNQIAGVDMKSEFVELFKNLDLEAGVKEITELLKSLYKKNAKLDIKDNEYTITFTDDGLMDMAFDTIEGYLDTEYVKNLGLDEEALDMGDVDMAEVKSIAKGLDIFGENDALVIKSKLNEKGQATEIEESVHIDFNIVELAAALGEDAELMYPLTKENSDIDLTFKSRTVYDKLNEENVVVFPTLTEENSIGFMELVGVTMPEDDYYVPELEFYQSEFFWDNAKGLMDRGGMYARADEFFMSCLWDDDNLTGEVELSENGNVTMTITSDNFGTVTVKGSLYSDEYMLNNTKLWARKPFKTVTEYDWDDYEGTEAVYVNMDVLHYILGAKVQSIQTYILDDELKELTTPEYYFEIVRPNPAYVAPVEQ